MSDAIIHFRAAMDSAGVAPAEPIALAPGQLIRFRAEGDKPGRRNGWAILHTDGNPSGAFGNWRLGIRHSWRADGEGRDLSPRERRAIAARIRDTEAAKERLQVETAELAAAIYRGSTPADQRHAYLTAKALAPIGVRQHGRDLIVPMIDEHLALWNLQRIAGDGTKRFLPRGRTAGLFWQHAAIKPGGGATDGPLVLAEGWATAAAIHEATGFGVAAAMSAANLLAVAMALRRLFPAQCIVIAADWDGHLTGNMGLMSARKAAESIAAYLAAPVPVGQATASTELGIDFADIPRVQAAALIYAAIGGELR